MSLNLKALLKKPQRSQFRTPFKTPSQPSPLTSSSFKIPSLTLSNTSSRKRSSRSLSPDSVVLPPRKVQHKDVEPHIEEEVEGGVGDESQESVRLPLPPSPSPEVTPIRARETPGSSGDTTHVSDTPSWGPSPTQSVSPIENKEEELPSLIEHKEDEEELPYKYEGGANFEMDLSDLDKEYPIIPQSELEPEPEKPYANMDEVDFQDDCESDYLSPSQQELVTPPVPGPSKVSFTVNYQFSNCQLSTYC